MFSESWITMNNHFLRDSAAATPPARSPTAVAAMPMPITPSACGLIKKKKQEKEENYYLFL